MIPISVLDELIAYLGVRIEKLDPTGKAKRSYYRLFDNTEKKLLPGVRLMMNSANRAIAMRAGSATRNYKSAKDIVEHMADWESIMANMKADISPYLMMALTAGGKAVVENRLFLKKDRFDPIGVSALSWVNDHGSILVKEVTETTKQGLRTATQMAINQGMGPAEMARYIRPQVGLLNSQVTSLNKKYLTMINGTRKVPPISHARAAKKLETLTKKAHMYRTNMIARTETSSGLSAGQLQGFGQMGVQMVRWVVFSDGCEICQGLGGQEFTLLEADGMIPQHPLCYIEGTEVYTSEGWRDFRDIEGKEKFLSFTQDELKMEWLHAINYIAYRYTGKTYELKNRKIHLVVTPDHNQVCGIRGDGGYAWKIKPIKELILGDEIIIPRIAKSGPDIEAVSLKDKVNILDYDGMVYDVELPKNHILWIRYKGKTCLSCNCRCTWVASRTTIDPYAKKLYDQSVKYEPGITRGMKIAAGKANTSLARLDNRLKTQTSINRKLAATLMENPGMTASQVADTIKDTVRYTTIAPSKEFAQSVNAMHMQLESQGYELKKVTNYFGKKGPYQGINAKYFDPKSGLTFEMQYHTSQSLAIAGRNHKIYDVSRVTTNAAEKMALETQMINSYDDFILPDGADILFPDLK